MAGLGAKIGLLIIAVVIVVAVSAVMLQKGYAAPAGASGSVLFTVSDANPHQVANISSVFVTVTKVDLHSASTGNWYNVSGGGTYNLSALSNVSSEFGSANVPNGIYNIAVLHISNVTVVSNGTQESAFLPSGRIMISGEFNVSNTTSNWMDFDFNLSSSLHVAGSSGKIVFLPVIQTRVRQGSSLSVGNGGIVSVRSSGRLVSSVNEGMSVNGTMVSGLRLPLNVSIGVSVGGAGASVNANGAGASGSGASSASSHAGASSKGNVSANANVSANTIANAAV